MEEFNKLPFPQKMAALIGVMVVVAGLFYYAMIIPIDEQAQQVKQRTAQLQGEVTKLKKETESYKDTDFKKETQNLEEKKARFEELLPPREEITRFITDLSDSAKAAGLTLDSFEKGEPVERNYYVQVPIDMAVKGTFREIIGFFRQVADPERRVVNIVDLKINTEPVDVVPILQKYSEQRLARVPPGATLKVLSPAQNFMQRVNAYEEAIASGLDVNATFTANVFVYTGVKASDEVANEIQSEAEEIKNRRKARRGLVQQ